MAYWAYDDISCCLVSRVSIPARHHCTRGVALFPLQPQLSRRRSIARTTSGEVFLKIDGQRHDLWRAVDQDGNVLSVLC